MNSTEIGYKHEGPKAETRFSFLSPERVPVFTPL